MLLGDAQTHSLTTRIEEEIVLTREAKVCVEEKIACLEEELAYMKNKRTHMEVQIHQQTLSLFRLRATQRNSLLPIFRLPPELLSIIFIYGARDYYESNCGGHFSTRIPTWVNPSYVCSHWRNIALDCPTLWTYHFNTSLRWTEELLHRSKEAPLKVACIDPYGKSLNASRWRSLLENLLKHSERIQELCLEVPPSFLPAELSLSAPYLKKLEMCFRQDIPMQSIAIVDGGKLPLRTLKLSRCSLSWNSLNLSGLTALSLCDIYSPSPVNIVEFLATLRGMQGLKLLHLEHALPSAGDILSSGSLSVSPKINLPHLALLAVTAPVSTVVALLPCIDIPLQTRLSLQPLFERNSSIDDYSLIYSFLAQQFRILEPSSSFFTIFRSLVIDAHYPAKLTFSSLERDLNPGTPLTDMNIPLEITLQEEDERMVEPEGMTESNTDQIMSNICGSLPLANVETLYVIVPEIPSPIWEDIFGRLRGLRFMKLHSGYMPDLSMLALTTNEPRMKPDEKLILDHVFLPVLEELELSDITFLPEDRALEGSHMSQESLFNVLSTREGLRDRLIMIDCGLYIESESDDSGSP